MANLISGKLPPPQGMSYEQFLDHSMYVALREFIYAYQGAEKAKRFDEAYNAGQKINQDLVARHPLGRMIGELGSALHGGAVMPGWNSGDGTMDWSSFGRFVRWYAKLPDKQKVVALRRIREGSETPWVALPSEQRAIQIAAQQQRQEIEQQSTGLVRGTDTPTDVQKQPESTGLSTLSWLLIAALVVGAGFLLYKTFHKPEAATNPVPEEQPPAEGEVAANPVLEQQASAEGEAGT